jgi:surfeit locus 1 family protein
MLLAAACVRLGVWQLARYHEKKARAVEQEARLAEAPLSWDDARSLPLERVTGRRVRATGVWDTTRHVLLAYRERDGAPGVEWVTPLVAVNGARVLVDRGWLPADDAMRARPGEFPEPGVVEVTGVAESFATSRFGLYPLESGPVEVLSARALVRDTILARWPGPLAPFVLRRLPEPGASTLPRRLPPEKPELGMHLGYATQWFAFAAVIVIGGAALLRSRLRTPSAVLGSRLRSDRGDPSHPTP